MMKSKKKILFNNLVAFSIFLVILLIFFLNLNFFLDLQSNFRNLFLDNQDKLKLNEEVQILKNENALLKEEIFRLSEFKNLDLEKNKIALTKITSLSDLYGTFWLISNNNNALSTSTLIFDYNDTLIGNIDLINQNKYRVQILGTKNKFIAYLPESDENIELKSLDIGLYGGEISNNSKIKIGDIVLIDKNKKYIVGNVVNLENDESSLYKILVKTPLNIKNIQNFYAEE